MTTLFKAPQIGEPRLLKLSKAQYKQLCSDCAAEMMRGAGHGGKIPDFSGTDMKFYVKDPRLKGGGFVDTLSNTWQKVKTFVSESPLAQKVVKEGLSKGKALAKDVAGKAVQIGLEKLGIPESYMGTATALAGEAFDRLGDAAERKAQAEIIGKAPTTLPGVSNKPVSTTASDKRASAYVRQLRRKHRREVPRARRLRTFWFLGSILLVGICEISWSSNDNCMGLRR